LTNEIARRYASGGLSSVEGEFSVALKVCEPVSGDFLGAPHCLSLSARRGSHLSLTHGCRVLSHETATQESFLHTVGGDQRNANALSRVALEPLAPEVRV